MAIHVSPPGAAISQINITPLVDVMLVLLIIFMIAAPLMERERSQQELTENRDRQQRLVSLNLPVLAESQALPPEHGQDLRTVVLSISDALVVTLDKVDVVDCSAQRHATDKRAWLPCLDRTEAAVRAHPEARDLGVTVDAGATVPFGFVVAAMHRMHKAEVTKVGMLPK